MMRSFWERQQETFKLHLEARQNSSLLEDFTASDPVNGPIVKVSEKKILHGSLGISSGVAFSLLANLGLRKRKQQPSTNESLRRVLEFRFPSYTSKGHFVFRNNRAYEEEETPTDPEAAAIAATTMRLLVVSNKSEYLVEITDIKES